VPATSAVYERAARTIHCVSCPTAPAPEPEIDSGVAGRSARQEHERRATKRETAVKERWGDRIGGVVLALTDEPQSTRAWAVGARGEVKVATALVGFIVLHDRRVSGTKGNIDHIVIAPAGLFVVDAKHFEGRIEIRNHGWFLRPNERLHVGRRDCSALADKMGWQVTADEQALLAAGVDPLPPITPVLCFVDDDWPLIAAPDVFRGVRLESTQSLRRRLGRTSVIDEAAIWGTPVEPRRTVSRTRPRDRRRARYPAAGGGRGDVRSHAPHPVLVHVPRCRFVEARSSRRVPFRPATGNSVLPGCQPWLAPE